MKGNNQISILILLISAIVAFGWYNFRTAPLRHDLQTVQQQHDQAKAAAIQRVHKGQVAQAQYDTLKAKVTAGEARYKALLATLPTRREAGQLTDEIANVARHTGVTLASLTPSDKETRFSSDITFLTVKIASTGNYDQTMAFLHGLEHLDRFASISKLGLSRHADNWQNPTLSADIALDIYLYRGANAAQ